MIPGRHASPLGYRPHLDGVRAVAVALVIAFHAGVPWASAGFVGVDVFFVLSGYLITMLLVTELAASGGVELGRFYARRARRLLPGSLLVLVAVAIASGWLLDALDQRSAALDVRAAALYSANWHFVADARDYFAPGNVASPLVHYWSLAVEEQFYLLWPALLYGLWRLLGRRRALAVIVGLAVASAVLSVVLVPSRAAYFGTHTRAYQLLAGATLALVLARRVGPVAAGRARLVAGGAAATGAVAIVWLAHAVPDATGYPGVAGLAVTAASVALVAGLELGAGGPVRGLLASRPLAATGRLSYSLYLWHWPVFVFAPLAAVRLGWGALDHLAVQLALVVGFSLASYQLVERPIRFRLWTGARARRVIAGSLAASAVAGITVAAVLGPGGAPAAEAMAAVTDLARPIDGCPYFANDWPDPDDSRPCVVREGAAFTVALVGDSHAQMWAPTLDALAERYGFTFVTVTRGGCPANDMLVYHLDENGRTVADEECSAWRDSLYRRLVSDVDPDVIVLSTRSYVLGIREGERDVAPRDPAHLPLWRDAFERGAAELAAGGATVLVSEILPTLPERVPACLATHGSASGQCDFEASVDVKRNAYNAAIEALGVAIPGVQPIDPEPIVCPEGLCPAEIGGLIVHRDDNHITATFAAAVADEFLALLERAGATIAA